MWGARERKKREVRRRPLSTIKAQVMRETQEIQKIRERHKANETQLNKTKKQKTKSDSTRRQKINHAQQKTWALIPRASRQVGLEELSFL